MNESDKMRAVIKNNKERSERIKNTRVGGAEETKDVDASRGHMLQSKRQVRHHYLFESWEPKKCIYRMMASLAGSAVFHNLLDGRILHIL